ncbi:MAG: helix-turn-helix protein [Solirubrobacteraceae bacterium]|nr:helix-turn-helix protein [Solirubrobacteraceae bacterium]
MRIARQRAGLTQAQVAQRSGHPRESIARWETGAREPSLETLRHVVEACELDLVVSLARRDPSLAEAVADQISLTPKGRLRRLLGADQASEALAALRWLARARTPVIVIGDVAAALHGAGQQPRSSSVEFVAGDPLAVEAELRAAGAPAVDTEQRWADTDRRAEWILPRKGRVVLASAIPGTDDYSDLRRSAVMRSIDATSVAVAHPRDLLRMAEASAKEASRSRAPGLRALLSAAWDAADARVR